METTQEILARRFDGLKTELAAAYNAKGMRASGKFEESLEVIATDTSVILIGEDYAQQLETGRRPGPVSKEGQESIKQWILDKGVFTAALEEISLSSLAYLITRKIARDGFNREAHGGVNLVSEVVTPEKIQSIIDEVGPTIATRYATDLVRILKTLN
jgi:hypothetical protein